jgi:hypothetical protein
MKQIWDGTFSLQAYRAALNALRKDFPTNYLIAEIPQIVSQIHRPKILIRHDIAGSLRGAWDMACLERDLEYRASYMIRDDSPLIDLTRPEAAGLLRRIRELGHEIGLFLSFPEPPVSAGEVGDRVAEAGARLSDLLGFPIFSVSISIPIPDTPEDSQFMGGKVNATAPLMMRWTLEDSQPPWELEPPRAADEDPSRALLQVIVRPEAWSSD